jgi:phosphoribosylformimino-5-aminoimidazole carboxamide ribotide isomerase
VSQPTPFVVFPAIDLLGGRCVRLEQGDYARATAFSDDPVATARRWTAEGAAWLHVVDLDAARGGGDNRAAIEAIVRAVPIPVQVGGGVRSVERAADLLALGAARVVFGTVAVTSPQVVAAAARRFPDQVAVALDTRAGRLLVHGWQEQAPLEPLAVARPLAAAGVRWFVVTDTARDGTLAGPNLDALAAFTRAIPASVIAAGGIGTVEDLRRVRAAGAVGAIVGLALYTGALTLPQALAATAA